MKLLGATVLVGVALIAACGSGDPVAADPKGGATGDDTSGGAGASHSGSGEAPACEGPLGAPADPASLTACCPDYGSAHCVEKIPGELESLAATCDGGGWCVPDEFIATGGVFTPPSCTSIGGAAGVCLSACIPAVAEKAALLPQDGCAEHERCVPCINPLDKTETGACKLAFSCDDPGGEEPPPDACDDPTTCVYDCPTPAVDLSTLDECPGACGGHCLDAMLVPADQASKLAACDAGRLCVPDDVLVMGGKLVPETCESIAGFEGRCLSECLPDVAAKVDTLPASTCSSGHRCVPCYDPFDGTATGACSQSCDAGPKEPAQKLPECCGSAGSCVPSSAVPADKASSFGQDSCPGGQDFLCVPETFLAGPYVPTTCTPSGLIFLFTGQTVGACLKKCMPDVGSADYVDQGECQSDEYCIPCFDQQGAKTGACETDVPCPHAACETGEALTWGCDGSDDCVTWVCEADPYCCTNEWDDTCVSEVETYCYKACP